MGVIYYVTTPLRARMNDLFQSAFFSSKSCFQRHALGLVWVHSWCLSTFRSPPSLILTAVIRWCGQQQALLTNRISMVPLSHASMLVECFDLLLQNGFGWAWMLACWLVCLSSSLIWKHYHIIAAGRIPWDVSMHYAEIWRSQRMIIKRLMQSRYGAWMQELVSSTCITGVSNQCLGIASTCGCTQAKCTFCYFTFQCVWCARSLLSCMWLWRLALRCIPLSATEWRCLDRIHQHMPGLKLFLETAWLPRWQLRSSSVSFPK